MGECMNIFVRKSDVVKLSWFDFVDLIAFIAKWDGMRWRWLEGLFNDHFSKLDKTKFRELKDNLIGKCKFECYIRRIIEDWGVEGGMFDELYDEIVRWNLYQALFDIFELKNIDVVIVSDYTDWPKRYRENDEYVSGETLLTLVKNCAQKNLEKGEAVEQ